MTPAKRGDLLAIERTSRITYTNPLHSPDGPTVRVYLARVTSVARTGRVKSAVSPDGQEWREHTLSAPYIRLSTLAATSVDVDAVLSAYAERRYPTAPTSPQVPPFDDMHAARAFLKDFLL